jgi:hypothetical protein
MSAPRASITTSKASLIGGIAVGAASLVLWLAVMHELGFEGPVMFGAGVLVSALIGVWVRVADL